MAASANGNADSPPRPAAPARPPDVPPLRQKKGDIRLWRSRPPPRQSPPYRRRREPMCAGRTTSASAPASSRSAEPLQPLVRRACGAVSTIMIPTAPAPPRTRAATRAGRSPDRPWLTAAASKAEPSNTISTDQRREGSNGTSCRGGGRWLLVLRRRRRPRRLQRVGHLGLLGHTRHVDAGAAAGILRSFN